MDHLVSNTNSLKLENLDKKDFGLYQCVLGSKLNELRAEFQVIFDNHKKSEIVFSFIENDVRPYGQVVVICDSKSNLINLEKT